MGRNKLDLLIHSPGEFLSRAVYKVRSRVVSSISPSARRHAEVGPAFLWKATRDKQIQFLKEAGLEPHHHLLDIGCGTLRGGVPIIEYLDAGHYFGIEARAEVLKLAHEELAEEKLGTKSPTLVASGAVPSLQLDQSFDTIWAHSVLIHMSDEILDGCLAFVAAHLKDAGSFLANVNLGQREDGRWKQFPVVFRDLPFYQRAAGGHGLTCELHGEEGAWDDQTMLTFQIAG